AVGEAGVVIAGDDEAAAAQLDSVAGTGGVPGPAGQLHLRGDFGGRSPGDAIVAAAGDPDGAVARTGLALGDVAGVAGEQQQNGAGFSFDHRGRVADGVGFRVRDDLHGEPDAAVVAAATE